MVSFPAATVLDPSGRLTVAMLESAALPLIVAPWGAAFERVRRGHEFAVDCRANGRPMRADSSLPQQTGGKHTKLPSEVVRATMLARTWTLSRGFSGISFSSYEALRAALETEFVPLVRLPLSTDAAEKIALTCIAESLSGTGEAWLDETTWSAADALEELDLAPVRLGPGDASAMSNGVALAPAVAGLAAASLRRSLESALLLSALLGDLMGVAPDFLVPKLLENFGHAAATMEGEILRDFLMDANPANNRSPIDLSSVKRVPRLLGAARSAVDWAVSMVEDDLNGVADSVQFFPDEDLVAYGEGLTEQQTTFAANLLSDVATQVCDLAESQLGLLLGSQKSGESAHPASTPVHAMVALEQTRKLRLAHGKLAVALRRAAHLRQSSGRTSLCAELLDTLADVVGPIGGERPPDTEIREAADALDTFVVKRSRVEYP
ncbi:aromatic amino acid lyase [Amycolatopsis japonica]|uniref:aromatic amino acid lyase n=1 Tax=Amycolatopsis japonica TaxID=208439 RepID=UPI0036730214